MSKIHFVPESHTASRSAGVIVLHPWWGLNADILAFADRLAASGFTVAAPDLFDGKVATSVEEAERLSAAAEEDSDALGEQVLGSVDALLERIGDRSARLGVVGFSFGAGWALWLPSKRPECVATVVYYGTLEGPSLTRATAHVLGHFAENDQFEPSEAISALEGTLHGAGRDAQLITYPGTGHWFAEPSNAAYVADAAELAFERTVEFLKRQLLTA
jgi:carboxymethylenebutenolidase